MVWAFVAASSKAGVAVSRAADFADSGAGRGAAGPVSENGIANSWAGRAYGVGPHAQDWFWVCLAGWRAQILTFHPFPIKPHEFFIGKG